MDSIVRIGLIRYLHLHRMGRVISADKALQQIRILMNKPQHSLFRREIRTILREERIEVTR